MYPDFGIQSIHCEYPNWTVVTEIYHKEEFMLAITKPEAIKDKPPHSCGQSFFRKKNTLNSISFGILKWGKYGFDLKLQWDDCHIILDSHCYNFHCLKKTENL